MPEGVNVKADGVCQACLNVSSVILVFADASVCPGCIVTHLKLDLSSHCLGFCSRLEYSP